MAAFVNVSNVSVGLNEPSAGTLRSNVTDNWDKNWGKEPFLPVSNDRKLSACQGFIGGDEKLQLKTGHMEQKN